MAVDLVDKDDARLGILVSRRDDPVPDVGCVNHARHRRFLDDAIREVGGLKREFVGKCRCRPVSPAIHYVIRPCHRIKNRLGPGLILKLGLEPNTAVDRVHKQVRNCHGYIEICEAGLVVLGVDKPQDVRMRHAQNTHVSASSNTALLYHLCRLIDDVHKAHGPRCDASRRVDHRTRGAQKLVRHSGASARLVDDGNILCVLHNAFDRIRHIEDKAGCELALRLTRIDETGRVWNELAGEHHRGHIVVKQLLLKGVVLGL